MLRGATAGALVLALLACTAVHDVEGSLPATVQRVNTTEACTTLLGLVVSGQCGAATADSCPEACRLSVTSAYRLINATAVNLTRCAEGVYNQTNSPEVSFDSL